MISWRTSTIVLAILCLVQWWHHAPLRAPVAAPAAEQQAVAKAPWRAMMTTSSPAPAKPVTVFGYKPPTWAQGLLPQPGEKPSAYRDRILPLAELAIAPQRQRVAKIREQLPDAQRAALDTAAKATAQAIEDRITQAILDGEIQMNALKPMDGVRLAREVLDLVDQGNTDMISSLTSDQRAQLAASHFDFADYLAVATHWEDALHH